MAMNNLRPADGPAKWRDGMVERFRSNAARCRSEAMSKTDREERAYTQNLALLWEQLAEAAEFRKQFSQ